MTAPLLPFSPLLHWPCLSVTHTHTHTLTLTHSLSHARTHTDTHTHTHTHTHTDVSQTARQSSEGGMSLRGKEYIYFLILFFNDTVEEECRRGQIVAE